MKCFYSEGPAQRFRSAREVDDLLAVPTVPSPDVGTAVASRERRAGHRLHQEPRPRVLKDEATGADDECSVDQLVGTLLWLI